MRPKDMVTVALISVAATPLLLGLAADSASAQSTPTSATSTTTTSVLPTTTTIVPPTTAPSTTTTTRAPTTTSTRVHPTTTTSHPTTTTATTVKSSSSSKVWGWVLLAVAIVVAIILVLLLLARTRRRGRETDWERLARPAVAAAELARDLVQSQTETDDQQRRASVGVQVDEAVQSLERAAAGAPDEALGAMCRRSAESLRGLAFAIEADHLMRSGGEHPTGEQLAAADAARRNRSAEFEAALADLKFAVTPRR